MLQQKTTIIDFNSLLSCGDILGSLIRTAINNEQRAYSLFANPGFYTKTSIQNLCQPIQRQSSSQIFLLFRSIFNNGFLSIDMSRQFKRCQNLLASFRRQTVSLRLQRKNFSKHFGRCKRKKKLANISRLCTSSDSQSQRTLRERRFWYHIGKYNLRFGRNRHRSMLVAISMGSASQAQKCGKTSYINGPERLYTDVYTHYKRSYTRNNGLFGLCLWNL